MKDGMGLMAKGRAARSIPGILAAAGWLAAFPPPPAHAQQSESTPHGLPAISTDRPDLTETASLIPPGFWQIESGLTRERVAEESGELRRLAVVEVLARAGLSELIEARLGTGYVHQRTSGSPEADRGLAGLMAGVKVRLGEGFGLLAHVHLPIGSEALRLPDVAPEAVLAGETMLTDWLELSANVGGLWLSEEATLFATTALGFDLTEKLGVFVEGFCAGAMDAAPLYQGEGGVTYLMAPNLQLDCTGGMTLFDGDPGWFLGAGISARFPE
jgi:hypothetical protein